MEVDFLFAISQFVTSLIFLSLLKLLQIRLYRIASIAIMLSFRDIGCAVLFILPICAAEIPSTTPALTIQRRDPIATQCIDSGVPDTTNTRACFTDDILGPLETSGESPDTAFELCGMGMLRRNVWAL
jgi:hypothetical protein